MFFFRRKHTYTDNGFSLKYPFYMRRINLDEFSVTFINPNLPGESLTLSRILLNQDESLSTKQIVEGETGNLRKSGQVFQEVRYKNLEGIYYSKISRFSEEEKTKLREQDPTAENFESMIHRWVLGDRHVCFIFTFAHPNEPAVLKRLPDRMKVISAIFKSIRTKKPLTEKDIESEKLAAASLYESFDSFMYGRSESPHTLEEE